MYDDQGIPGQVVKVVESGILMKFLTSRTPMSNYTNSSGHGRAQASRSAVTRQSNMFVESDHGVSENELRKKLIKEC